MTDRETPLTDAEFDAMVGAGHQVLQVFPRTAGACVMMSALYVGRLHDLGHKRARMIGGSLAIDGAIVFGRSAATGDFSRTDLEWDGHAWIHFGEYIADVSLVQTAYDPRAPICVARHVTQLRKPNQRLYIATPAAAACDDGLLYTPQHVFSDDQITALYRGALTFLPSV